MLQTAQRAVAMSDRATAPKPPVRQADASRLGNQARLRTLTASAPSGALRIGAFNDPLEREADAVAERVMRMADSGVSVGRTPPQVNRKCAACEEEKRTKLQPKCAPSTSGATAGAAPPIVHEVLRSPGRPLDAATRAFMEPRFGRNFGAVRTHTDGKAAASASAVQALAYTVGNDVVFAQQQYAPDTPGGKRLLAHELAHVVQQQGPATAGTAPAPGLSAADAPTRLRRTVTVTPAAEVADVVDYFNFMCPQNFTSDGQRIVSNCTDPSGPSCECLCDVARNSSRSYLIRVFEATAGAEQKRLFDGSDAVVTTTSKTPGTLIGQDPIVDIPAAGSEIEFGEFAADGSGIWPPVWRILAHEMCGHGRLRTDNTKDEAAVGRSGQDATVAVENAIATEHGELARGFFVLPRFGASFFNVEGYRALVRFDLPDGAHFESPDGPSQVGDYPEPDPNRAIA